MVIFDIGNYSAVRDEAGSFMVIKDFTETYELQIGKEGGNLFDRFESRQLGVWWHEIKNEMQIGMTWDRCWDKMR